MGTDATVREERSLRDGVDVRLLEVSDATSLDTFPEGGCFEDGEDTARLLERTAGKPESHPKDMDETRSLRLAAEGESKNAAGTECTRQVDAKNNPAPRSKTQSRGKN